MPRRRHIKELRPQSEASFQAQIIRLAELCKWRVYHVSNVKGHLRNRTSVGFPDLVLVRDRVIFAEIKAEKGRMTKAQKDWNEALHIAGAETYIWRPRDWEDITQILQKK